MVFMRSIALGASIVGIIGVSSAAQVPTARQEPWVPGTQNNTQEFYVTLKVTTTSLEKYNGWTRMPLLLDV